MRNLRNEVRQIVQEELSHSRMLNEDSDGYYYIDYGKTSSTTKTYKSKLSWDNALRIAEKLSLTLYKKGKLDTEVDYIGVEPMNGSKFAIIYMTQQFRNSVWPDSFENRTNYLIFDKAARRFLATNRTSYGEYI